MMCFMYFVLLESRVVYRDDEGFVVVIIRVTG